MINDDKVDYLVKMVEHVLRVMERSHDNIFEEDKGMNDSNDVEKVLAGLNYVWGVLDAYLSCETTDLAVKVKQHCDKYLGDAGTMIRERKSS